MREHNMRTRSGGYTLSKSKRVIGTTAKNNDASVVKSKSQNFLTNERKTELLKRHKNLERQNSNTDSIIDSLPVANQEYGESEPDGIPNIERHQDSELISELESSTIKPPMKKSRTFHDFHKNETDSGTDSKQSMVNEQQKIDNNNNFENQNCENPNLTDILNISDNSASTCVNSPQLPPVPQQSFSSNLSPVFMPHQQSNFSQTSICDILTKVNITPRIQKKSQSVADNEVTFTCTDPLENFLETNTNIKFSDSRREFGVKLGLCGNTREKGSNKLRISVDFNFDELYVSLYSGSESNRKTEWENSNQSFNQSQLVDSQQASETIDPNRDYRENRTERDETIPNTNKFKFEITEASRQCSIDQITKLRITYPRFYHPQEDIMSRPFREVNLIKLFNYISVSRDLKIATTIQLFAQTVKLFDLFIAAYHDNNSKLEAKNMNLKKDSYGVEIYLALCYLITLKTSGQHEMTEERDTAYHQLKELNLLPDIISEEMRKKYMEDFVKQYETQILRTLDFRVYSIPTPVDFIFRFAEIQGYTPPEVNLCQYIYFLINIMQPLFNTALPDPAKIASACILFYQIQNNCFSEEDTGSLLNQKVYHDFRRKEKVIKPWDQYIQSFMPVSAAINENVKTLRDKIDEKSIERKLSESRLWKAIMQFHSGYSFFELETEVMQICKLLDESNEPAKNIKAQMRRMCRSEKGKDKKMNFFNNKKSLIPYRNMITNEHMIQDVFNMHKRQVNVGAFDSPRLGKLYGSLDRSEGKLNNSSRFRQTNFLKPSTPRPISKTSRQSMNPYGEDFEPENSYNQF